METVRTAAPRPPRPGRTAVVVALAGVLVAAVLAVRDGTLPTTGVDLQRVAEAVEQGCREPSAELGATTGLALDGTVLAVTAPADPGAPVLVELEVHEWFRGPPLDRTTVRLDRGTVGSLAAAGEALVPGLRLLVSGRGWGLGETAPAAAGCGRTRVHDVVAAADWRADLPAPAPVGPDGPLARYPDAGWVRTPPDGGPSLTGVLLLDGGCLYVDDGLTRWVPVLPASSSGFGGSPPRLRVGTDLTDVGHPVRLGGLPAVGVPHSAAGPVDGTGRRAARLDPAGVPPACRDDAPRFVVTEPPGSAPASVVSVAPGDPLVSTAVEAARSGGTGPTAASGEVRRDQFGAASVRVAVRTQRAGELLVHVENVPVRAWPWGYAPEDATTRWSLDPAQARRLPAPAPGTQLAVVERADGTTQLLVRTGDRVVVSATADPSTAPGEPLQGRALLDVLAGVATAVATGSGAAEAGTGAAATVP